MKIKTVTIGNYKNLAKTTLQLSGVTALVSTNNYGKSNVLDAIQFGFDFISASQKSRGEMMRYIPAIPLVKGLSDKPYIFEIELDAPELGEYRFIRYGFSFRWITDSGDGARILDETLEMRSSESVRYTSYLKRQEGKCRTSKSNQNFRKITLADNTLAIDVMPALNAIDIADVLSAIRKLSCRMCSRLEMGSSFRGNSIEIGDHSEAAYPLDDGDIPRTLDRLRSLQPDRYNLFLEAIYNLFPEFQGVQLKKMAVTKSDDGDNREIAFEEQLTDKKIIREVIPYRIRDEVFRLMISSKYLNQTINIDMMSTGTKRIFWLLANAVFGNSYGASFLGVDEIEASIHPRMIKTLLESLLELMGDTVMLLTSHSPYLIQYLKQEAVYIGVPNEDGVAAFRKRQGKRAS